MQTIYWKETRFEVSCDVLNMWTATDRGDYDWCELENLKVYFDNIEVTDKLSSEVYNHILDNIEIEYHI